MRPCNKITFVKRELTIDEPMKTAVALDVMLYLSNKLQTTQFKLR